MAGNFVHINYDMSISEFKERFPMKKDDGSKNKTWGSLKGGMSKVHWATDLKYSRKVVLKFFDFDAEKEYKKEHGEATARRLAQDLAVRFALETEVSAQLNHPHTVRVYEAGTVAGYAPFMTMEYIDGKDLSQAIRAVRGANNFKTEELLLIVYEICDTIGVAHRKLIINRDIKPANVLLGKYGALKVIDWGLAKLLDGSEREMADTADNVSLLNVNAQVNTMEGTSMGTPAYMAPEQMVGASVDERTDIYLLAGVLYHGLTGHPPARDRKNRIDISEIEVPELKDIVQKCMQTDPDNRYQAAEDLKMALRDALGSMMSEKYVSEVGLLSKWLGRKKAGDIPEPLILSDIVKRWVCGSSKIPKPSGRIIASDAKTQKLKSRKRRR
jgi:serine/threonine-protein kinase